MAALRGTSSRQPARPLPIRRRPLRYANILAAMGAYFHKIGHDKVHELGTYIASLGVALTASAIASSQPHRVARDPSFSKAASVSALVLALMAPNQ